MTVSIIRWNWYRCQFLQCFRLRPVHRRCLFQLCHPSADGLRHSWYQSVCVLAGSPHSHDRAQCRFTSAPGWMSIVYLWRSCAQSAALVGVWVGLEASTLLYSGFIGDSETVEDALQPIVSTHATRYPPDTIRLHLERVPKSGARSDYSWRMIDFRLSMVDNRWSIMDFQLTATRSEIDNRPSKINNPSLNRILGHALLNF